MKVRDLKPDQGVDFLRLKISSLSDSRVFLVAGFRTVSGTMRRAASILFSGVVTAASSRRETRSS